MFYKFSGLGSKFHRLAACALLALSLAACNSGNSGGVAGQSTATTSAASQPFVVSAVPRTSVQAGTMYRYSPAVVATSEGAKLPSYTGGGRVLTYAIVNKPEWATFVESSGDLSGTPDASDVGTTGEIQIGVSDGTARATVGPFRIKVLAQPTDSGAPPPIPPTIAGVPASTVIAGQSYSFSPTVTDPSGQGLSFSIVNLPPWASFSTATGALAGSPTSANVGIYSNIMISVSGDGAPVSLPTFSIQVAPAADSAPTISGTPATTVAAGANYSFTPTAGDPDGNALTFSIMNAPSWASFNTRTGELSGTAPSGTHLSSNIVISVSDGTSSVALPVFSIEVQASTGGGGGHGIKFHPGHYIELDNGSGGGGLSGWLATIGSLAGKPGVAGVFLNQYPWSSMEFSEGVYSQGSGADAQGFAAIDQLLAACKAAGLQFMLGVEVEVYGTARSGGGSYGALPPYFDNLYGPGRPGYVNSPVGTPWAGSLVMTADIMDPRVTARLIALTQAYGARYDANPNFEMFSTFETSNAYVSNVQGYDQLVTQLISWAAAARGAFPSTGVRIASNFLDTAQQLTALFNGSAPYGIAQGGPDVYLNIGGNGSFLGISNLVFNGYTQGKDWRGSVPWVSEVQQPDESGNNGATMAALYNEMMSGSIPSGGSMRPHYFIWQLGAGYLGGNAFTTSGILAFIASVHGQVNTQRPSSY